MTTPRPPRQRRPLPKLLIAFFILFPIVATFVVVAGILTAENEKDKNDVSKTITFVGTSVDNPATDLPRSQNLSLLLDSAEKLEPGAKAELANAPCFKFTYVEISVVLTSIDVASGSYKAKINPKFCGDFIDPQRVVNGKNTIPGKTITVYVENKEYVFPKGKSAASIEHISSFDSGSPLNYPFDKYISENFWIGATFLNDTTNRTDTAEVALGLGSVLTGHTVSHRNVGTVDQAEPLVVSFDFTVGRARLTLVFSVFVMIVMWMLALLGFAFTSFLLAWGLKSEPPVIAYSVAMLFALPGVRNTQPGGPPIGCTSDLISFFWVMMIISLNVGLLILNFIYRTFLRAPTPPAAPAPAPTKPDPTPSNAPIPVFPTPKDTPSIASPTATTSSQKDLSTFHPFPMNPDLDLYYTNGAETTPTTLVPPVRTRSSGLGLRTEFGGSNAATRV
ncbi:hypothetical protein HDU96_008612 [Phlyctochytrium bullatum]|nr:hypothetical protein HDU96_008612 [Phlyctochytrium bullatum]